MPRKRVAVFLDESAEKDLARQGIAPEEILKKIVYIFQKENGLDFSYNLCDLTIRSWWHKKPPRQFWGKTYKCTLHDFLFTEAEKKIINPINKVIFVFTGDLWVSSGITRLGWDGNGIILIGTRERIINPFDALMNRTQFKYVFKKILNMARFFIFHPGFLLESKRNRYLLALAATGVHEQAHAFGIRHSKSYSVMNDANIWYWQFDEASKIKLKSIFNGLSFI